MKNFYSHLLALFLSSILLFCPVIIQAAIVSGLYSADVPISNQSASSRNKQIIVALRATLIKITGDSQVASRDGIAAVLANANQYVQHFEYRRAVNQQLVLWVHFSKSLLDKVLRQLAIPVWGKERPIALVWLAVNDAFGRHLVSEDTSIYIEQMNQYAKDRGMLLTYPLLDLQDTNQLKITDIWGDFHEIVLAASDRYGSDVIVKGRVEMINAKLWEAHWTLYIDQQIIPWMVKRDSLKALLKASVDHATDTIAMRYVQAGSYIQSGAIKIIVSGIDSYSQYAKTLNYLASLNSVVSIDVQSVATDEVVYFLETAADISVLSKSIDLGNILKKIDENNYKLR